MVPCVKCEGEGQVTDDMHEQSLAALRAEAGRSKSNRLELAIREGALSMKNCPRCGGRGKVPQLKPPAAPEAA